MELKSNMKFPANIHKELKNYIYALYDSADDSGLPFYVGRGVGGTKVWAAEGKCVIEDVKTAI